LLTATTEAAQAMLWAIKRDSLISDVDLAIKSVWVKVELHTDSHRVLMRRVAILMEMALNLKLS
jgi:hypothetical protein